MAFTGMATTFRTLGVGLYPYSQPIFTIENLATSGVVVYVRRLIYQVDNTAALTLAIMPQVKAYRFATPASTVGTTLAKGTMNTAQASSTLVQLRGATATDGGAATTIAYLPGTAVWQSLNFRMQTLVGRVLGYDTNVLPLMVEEGYDFKLAAT